MDQLKEALSSGNIIVWIIAIVVLVIVLRLLKNAGKLAVIIVFLVILGVILHQFAPGVIDPLIDFVKGGWLGN